MRALLVAVALALAAVASTSCTDSIEVDSGLDADLQVDRGQFYREPLPAENGGPAVKAFNVPPRITPGTLGNCNGTLEPSATGVAIALEGDRGYWVIPAGIPDVTTPGAPTFTADVSYSAKLTEGTRNIQVRAVDEQGRFGPAAVKPLKIAKTKKPSGPFVISLTWDTDADLDLHVVDPTGAEIWKRDISSYVEPPVGSPPLPAGQKKPGGKLDFDSNASCVRDGRRAENVVYELPPPKGHYLVRVDTFSLCEQPNAYWRVEAILDGKTIGASEGLATEFDTRFSHDRGAGVLALEVDVP